MMTSHDPQQKQKKRMAAQEALEDVLWLVRGGSEECPLDAVARDEIAGEKFADLLKKNFKKLDPTGTAISKEHLAKALMKPDQFSDDEYVMLQLLAKYFDTIANMCDDEPGPQTVITSLDSDVLCEFLIHSNLSLPELHKWRKNAEKEDTARADATDLPPPPLSY